MISFFCIDCNIVLLFLYLCQKHFVYFCLTCTKYHNICVSNKYTGHPVYFPPVFSSKRRTGGCLSLWGHFRPFFPICPLVEDRSRQMLRARSFIYILRDEKCPFPQGEGAPETVQKTSVGADAYIGPSLNISYPPKKRGKCGILPPGRCGHRPLRIQGRYILTH